MFNLSSDFLFMLSLFAYYDLYGLNQVHQQVSSAYGFMTNKRYPCIGY